MFIASTKVSSLSGYNIGPASRFIAPCFQNALIYGTLLEQFLLELRIGDDAFLDQ